MVSIIILVMNWITRFLARILDYFIFFGLVLFILDFFEIDLYYYVLAAVITPILFIPIETLLLKLFKTTLGKILFGYRYRDSLTLKDAFLISAKKGILTEPLFLPIINIIYAFIYLREIKKYKMKRWDEVSSNPLLQKFPKVFPYSLIVALTLFLSTICMVPEFAYEQFAKICNIERTSDSFDPSDPLSSTWTKISSETMAFSILFPKEPNYTETNYNVPSSDRVLVYKEYKHVEHLEYSLSSVDLPRNWTKWGSGIVFKSSLKLMGNIGTVKTNKKGTHKNFPSLDYELTQKDGKAFGRLVLVKDTLYRIEAKHPEAFSLEDKKVANHFFNSFIPK